MDRSPKTPDPISAPRQETPMIFHLDLGRHCIETEIRRMVSEGHEIIITTGGTGIGPRDFTPDVVKPLLDKEIPGIMDYIRLKYGAEKPNALLSRSIAGVSGKSLIFVLPGSFKAVKEYMSEILPMLNHLFAMMSGIDSH